MLPKRVWVYGSDERQVDRIVLRSGPLQMHFEPDSGFLRYIRLGDREVLRGIYAAVRDANWGTVPPELSDIRLQTGPDGFRLTFHVECQAGEIDFPWEGVVSGDAKGSVTFSMRGTARRSFFRNRIGICVLHPVHECAGAACTVTHVDGTTEVGSFPQAISPHQPFRQMRAIRHEVVPGTFAEVTFRGDVFEMEDQRNWTDASFKSYSTPLDLPFPVQVQAGEVVEQSVTLRLHGHEPVLHATAQAGVTPHAAAQAGAIPHLALPAGEMPIELRVDPSVSYPIPQLGLGTPDPLPPLRPEEVKTLQALGLQHLRVDLDLSEPSFHQRLEDAAAQADALGTRLELALFVTGDAKHELQALRSECDRLRPPLARWLLFHRDRKCSGVPELDLAREHLTPCAPQVPLGGGTNAYFAELNRERPPVDALDFIAFSLNPQVHAFDHASLIESLAAQVAVAASAHQFAAGLPVAVSPITLRPRFNPNATGPEPTPDPDALPDAVDPRQMSLFGAGWTLGSVKCLTEGGATSLTYYETVGWRGVMEQSGVKRPAAFRSIPGGVFPLYHVLADIGEFAGGRALRSVSSAPLSADGLALERNGRRCVLLANYQPQTVCVRVTGLTEWVRVRRLDETSAEAAMRHPQAFRSQTGYLRETERGELVIALLPCAVARIDCVDAPFGRGIR